LIGVASSTLFVAEGQQEVGIGPTKSPSEGLTV
jgi:hypothetical protein